MSCKCIFVPDTYCLPSVSPSTAGPDKWCEKFEIANGTRQSPIDIQTSGASYDKSLKPLKLHYDPSTSLEILNNGHSIQVTFADDDDSSSL